MDTRRVECDLAGREGQWVRFRARLPWRLMRETIQSGRVAQEITGATGDSDSSAIWARMGALGEHMDIVERVINRTVVEWGMLDEDGQPLPIPSMDDRYLDELTQDEVYWLYGAATKMGEAEAKN